MTANKKIIHHARHLGRKVGAGLRAVWQRPLLLSGLLLVVAVFLGHRLIQEAFKPYTNCHYLIVNQLRMEPIFCEGYTLQVLGATLFTLPGLQGVLDQPLEQLRVLLAGSVLLFLAALSLVLTLLIHNFQAIVRLLRFDPAEWKKFLTHAQLWLLLFVGLGLVFYFTVVK